MQKVLNTNRRKTGKGKTRPLTAIELQALSAKRNQISHAGNLGLKYSFDIRDGLITLS